jgi:hypothetical protein
MKTIHKYSAAICATHDDFTIAMPDGAEVLCVQVQNNMPKVWALVDLNMPFKPRGFHWRGIGHPADRLGRYVGTIQIEGGALVFHLFETDPTHFKTLAMQLLAIES